MGHPGFSIIKHPFWGTLIYGTPHIVVSHLTFVASTSHSLIKHILQSLLHIPIQLC